MNEEELRNLVSGIENIDNEAGWDQIPTLHAHSPDQHVVMALAVPHPMMVLTALDPDEEMLVGAVSLVMMFEGWTYPQSYSEMLQVLDPDEARQQIASCPPSEHPDRVETRTVIGVTKEHEVHLIRRRGEEPSWFNQDEEEGIFVGGNFVRELRRLIGKT